MTDIAEGLSTTAVMSVGDEFLGTLEALNDTDWIAIQLVAGVTYSFNLGAGPSNSGSLFDTVLGIHDASGALVASNDDVGFTYLFNPAMGLDIDGSSFLRFTATTTGTYYLAATSYQGAEVGEYRLSAYQEDLPATANTPAQLQLGSNLTGIITSQPGGDHDAYTLSTVPGEYYTVTLSGVGSVAALLRFPEITARGADGTVIATNVNGSGDIAIQLTFQATSETTVLDVSASHGHPESIGQYTIRINEGSPTDAIELNIRPVPSHINVYFVGDADLGVPGGHALRNCKLGLGRDFGGNGSLP